MKTLENIDFAKPVQVYRNLNKPGVQFSVRQGGRVRCYVDSIILMDCKFKHANPKQLAEVRSGARQVCQWISGTFLGDLESLSAETIAQCTGERVSCDPKVSDGFTVNGSQIDSAEFVSLSANGCFAR
jgi:hypothetical protein